MNPDPIRKERPKSVEEAQKLYADIVDGNYNSTSSFIDLDVDLQGVTSSEDQVRYAQDKTIAKGNYSPSDYDKHLNTITLEDQKKAEEARFKIELLKKYKSSDYVERIMKDLYSEDNKYQELKDLKNQREELLNKSTIGKIDEFQENSKGNGFISGMALPLNYLGLIDPKVNTIKDFFLEGKKLFSFRDSGLNNIEKDQLKALDKNIKLKQKPVLENIKKNLSNEIEKTKNRISSYQDPTSEDFIQNNPDVSARLDLYKKRNIDEKTLKNLELATQSLDAAIEDKGGWSALFDKLSDVNTYTLGLKDFIDDVDTKLPLLLKRDRGEQLNEQEEDYLKSLALKENVESSQAVEKPFWYNAVSGTMDSVLFMAQMGLGTGAVSGVKKGLASTVAKNLLKSGINKKASKISGAVASGVSSTIGGHSLMPLTYQFMIDRYKGVVEPQYDDEGNITGYLMRDDIYEKINEEKDIAHNRRQEILNDGIETKEGELEELEGLLGIKEVEGVVSYDEQLEKVKPISWGKAIRQGAFESINEGVVERFGGKLISAGASKLKAVKNFTSQFIPTKIGKIYKTTLERTDGLRRAVGFNNPVTEYLEELIVPFPNSLNNGNLDEITALGNVDTHLDILGQVALMTGGFKAIGSIASIPHRINNPEFYKDRKKIRKFFSKLNSAIEDKEIRDLIDFNTVESGHTVLDHLKMIFKLRSKNKGNEANDIEQKMFYNLALTAFKTNTADEFIIALDNLSKRKGVSQNTVLNAERAKKDISKLKSVYDRYNKFTNILDIIKLQSAKIVGKKNLAKIDQDIENIISEVNEEIERIKKEYKIDVPHDAKNIWENVYEGKQGKEYNRLINALFAEKPSIILELNKLQIAKEEMDHTIRDVMKEFNKRVSPEFQKTLKSLNNLRADFLAKVSNFKNPQDITDEFIDTVINEESQKYNDVLKKSHIDELKEYLKNQLKVIKILQKQYENEVIDKKVNKNKAKKLKKDAREIIDPELTNKESEFQKIIADLFSPEEDGNTINENDILKEKVQNAYNKISNIHGDKLSFERFLQEILKFTPKEIVKQQFNSIKLGWELNNYSKTDFNAIFNDIFNDVEESSKNAIEPSNLDKSAFEQRIDSDESVEDQQNDIEQSSAPVLFFTEDNIPIKSVVGNRTVIPDLKLGFNAVRYEEVVDKYGNLTKVDTEDETLNTEDDDVINFKDLLNPDKFNSGTKLSVQVAPEDMWSKIQIFEGRDKNGKVIKTSFKEWFDKKTKSNPNFRNTKEFKDKVPVFVLNEQGNPVAFIHEADWYNPYNIADPSGTTNNVSLSKITQLHLEVIEAGKRNVSELRRRIIDEGLSEIKIETKLQGPVKRISKNKPEITINEANPQSVLAVQVGNKLMTGFNTPFENDQRIIVNSKKNFREVNSKGKYETEGRIWDLRRIGVDPKTGKETWRAFSVIVKNDKGESNISSRALETLKWMYAAYATLKGDETYVKGTSYEMTIDKAQTIRDQIKSISGVDLLSESDTLDFFKLYGTPKNEGLEISLSLYGNKLYKGLPSIFKQVPNVRHLSNDKLKMIYINNQGEVEDTGSNYQEYLKNNLYTNVLSFNVGTDENPVYATSIQPKIIYTYDSKKVRESENIEDEIKNNIEKIIPKKSKEKSIDQYIQQTNEFLKNLGFEEDFNENFFDEFDAIDSLQNVFKVALGLNISQEEQIVNYLALKFLSKKNRKKNKNKILEQFRESYTSVILPSKVEIKSIISQLEIYKEKTQGNNAIQDQINKFNNVLKVFDSIQYNWGNIESKALKRVEEYSNLSAKNGLSDKLTIILSTINKPANGFLGLSKYMDLDTVYNKLSESLNFLEPDLDLIFSKLEKGEEFWMNDLLEILKNSPKQIQNEFVSHFGKKNIRKKYTIQPVVRGITYILDRIRNLKLSSATNKEFLSNLKNISFSKNSVLLDLLINNPEFGKKFNIYYLTKDDLENIDLVKITGFQDIKKGDINRKYKDFSLRMGTMIVPVGSKPGQIIALDTGVFNFFKDNSLAFNIQDDGSIKLSSAIKELLYDQLILPELNRIFNFHKNIKATNISGYDLGSQIFNIIPELNNVKDENGIRIIKYLAQSDDADISTIENMFKDILMDTLENIIHKNADNIYNKWYNNSLVEKSNGKIVSNKLFDSEYLKSNNEAGDNSFKFAVYDFVLNNMIFNANIFSTILGDPAIFSQDKLFENLPVDNNKIKNIASIYDNKEFKTYSSYIDFKNHLESLYESGKINEDLKKELDINITPLPYEALEDSFYLDIFRSIEKRIQENSNLLLDSGIKLPDSENENFIQIFLNSDSNVSEDQQEYTTLNEHLDILHRLGKISRKELNNIKNKVSNNKTLDSQELDILLQPIKSVYSGQFIDNEQDLSISQYFKTSSLPLIPQLTYGSELDVLRKNMEALERKYGMGVRASYMPSNKVGVIKNPSNISYQTSLEDIENSFLVLNRNNFKIQSEDKNGKEILESLSKISNFLFTDGVLESKSFNYNGENISGKELYEKYNNIYKALVDFKKQQLFKELGLDDNGNAINPKQFIKNLQELLKKEGINNNLSNQELKNLEIEEKKNVFGDVYYEFKTPLWLTAENNKFEKLLNDIITNRIMQHSMPGSSFVMRSFDFIKNSENIDIIYLNNWDGSKLDSVKNKQNQFEKVQVLLPSKIKTVQGELLDLFKKEKGEYVYLNKNVEGKYTLKEDMIPSELFNQFHFKTPFVSITSNTPIEVVGILPPEFGDLMVAPNDFADVNGNDLQFIYQLNHIVLDNNKVEVLSEKHNKILSKNKTSHLSDEFNQKLLENELIKIHQAIYDNMPDRFEGLNESFILNQLALLQDLKEKARKQFEKDKLIAGGISDIQADNNIKNSNTDNYILSNDNLENDLSVNEVSQKYLNAIFAHAILQQSANDIGILEKIVIGKSSSKGLLGLQKTIQEDKNISDILVEKLNAVSEQFINEVGLNDQILDVDILLTLLGFNKDENGNSISYLLLSQPIIKDYIKEISSFKNENSIIKNLLAKYGKNKFEFVSGQQSNIIYSNTKEPISNSDNAKFLTGDGLLRGIELNGNDAETQILALNIFIKLDNISKNINRVQSLLNTNSLGESLLETKLRYDNLLRLNENDLSWVYPLLGDVKNEKDKDYLKIGNIFIKPQTVAGQSIINGLSLGSNIWKQFFSYFDDYFIKIVQDTFNEIPLKYSSPKKELEIKNLIVKEIEKYLFSRSGIGLFDEDTNLKRKKIFLDTKKNTSLAKYLSDIQNIDTSNSEYQKGLDLIKENVFLQNLSYELNTDGRLSTIIFNLVSDNNIQDNTIHNSILELLSKNYKIPSLNNSNYTTRDLAKDLISYFYISGNVSLTKYIPSEYLKSVGVQQKQDFVSVKDVFQSYNTNAKQNVFATLLGYDDSLFHTFTKQYFQHHPENVRKIALNKGSILSKKVKNKVVQSFILNPSNQDVIGSKFLTVENNTKGSNKQDRYSLFEHVGNNEYHRIDILGINGISEYQFNERNAKSLITNNFSEPVKKQIIPISFEDVDYNNPLDINENSSLYDVIDRISKTNSGRLSEVAKVLLPLLNNSTKFQIEENSLYRGRFDVNDNKVYISKDVLSDSIEKASKTILHEAIHSITSKELRKYYNEDGLSFRKNVITPSYILNLHRVFNAFRKRIPKENIDVLLKKKEDQKNKVSGAENFTQEELELTYGAISIFEFVTIALTEKTFQDEMSKVSFKSSNKSIWSAFVESILKVINSIIPNLKKGSLTEAALRDILTFSIEEAKIRPQDTLFQSFDTNESDEILKYLKSIGEKPQDFMLSSNVLIEPYKLPNCL